MLMRNRPMGLRAYEASGYHSEQVAAKTNTELATLQRTPRHAFTIASPLLLSKSSWQYLYTRSAGRQEGCPCAAIFA